MSTNNDTYVVDKLAHLSIDRATTITISDIETETEPIREYSIADLVPVDDLAFHWLQATTINDDIPAWTPGPNVMTYLDDFIPAKKARLLPNDDQNLKSCKSIETSRQELNADIEIGSVGKYHVSLSNEKEIADRSKYRAQEDTISWRIGVAGTDVERRRNRKRSCV